jgi:prepilin-type N-terminal cleavage/methylation domain-containing protein
MLKFNKAFTLVEFLVVIGILTVIFAIVLIITHPNPTKPFSQVSPNQSTKSLK